MTLRDRVRTWMFGEEIQTIATVAFQVANLTTTMAQSINHEANILAGVSALQAHSVGLQSTIDSIQRIISSNQAQDSDLVKLLTEQVSQLLEGQERLLLLVQPVAQRGNRPVPAVLDWDQVQANNLEEFKE